MRKIMVALGAFFVVGFAGSTMPRMRELVLATVYKTADQVFQGRWPATNNIPCGDASGGASWTQPVNCQIAPTTTVPDLGEPLCGTATSQAAFESPAACGLAPSSTTAALGEPLCGTGAGTAAFESSATCGLAPSSNAPAHAAQLLCSTNAGAAAFFDMDAPNTKCDLKTLLVDETGSTTTAPSIMGWSATQFASGTTMQFRMGDNGGLNLFSIFGDKPVVASYHGLVINTARGATTLPTFSGGGGTADYGVTISPGGTKALQVNGSSILGTGGTAFSSTVEGSFNNGAPSVQGPGTCVSANLTVSGITAGSPCEVGTPATSTTTTNIAWCTYDTTNTATLHICNVGTANSSAAAGVYYCRCWIH